MTTVGGSSAATYTYDAFGNRVEENPEVGGGGTTYFSFGLNRKPIHTAKIAWEAIAVSNRPKEHRQ